MFFSLLSQADRVYVNPKIFYHYRRGTPSSAMSRLSRDAMGQDAKESQILFVKACASLLDDCSARLPPPTFTALLRRCYHAAFYYAKRNPSVIALLRGECRQSFRADEQTPQGFGEEDYDKYVWPILSLSGKLRNPGALVRRISKCFHDEGPWYTLKRMFAFGVGGPKKLRDHEKVLRRFRRIEEARQKTAKNFYNVVESEEDTLKLIESYAQRHFVLEPEKCALADTFFAYKKDVCQHVYEGIEGIIKERQKCEARGQNELSLGTDPCRICAIH